MNQFNGMSGKGPCRGCENAGCGAYHGKCEKYKAWRAELDRRNETVRKERKKFDTMSEASKREMWREKRYSRQQHSRSVKER